MIGTEKNFKIHTKTVYYGLKDTLKQDIKT